MRINTNISALTALGNLNKVQDAVSSSMEKLSSGFRINKAGDDAAGLGISNQLNADIRAMTQASRNAEQAGSVLQIMDGASQNVSSILERMKELAAQAASDSVDAGARTKINSEFGTLSSELDRIVSTTKFQGAALLNGTYGSKVNNGGAVNNAASTINGSGNIGSVVVSNAGTLQTVQGNITGAVSKVGNTIGTGVTGVAGSVVAVSNQATADTLTTAPVLFSSTFNTSTAVSTGGTYVVDGTDVSAIAFDNTASGSGSLIAGATYHFTAVANGGSNVDVKLLDSSNAQVGTTQTIAAGATTVAVNGVTLTLSGSLTQAQDITALNTKDFKVTQNYTVGLTGGGKVLQTASLADNGTSQSMAFTTYGITVQASTNTAALFQGKSLGVTEADKLTLSGTDTSGNALTQSININASAASQAMGFTTFGLTVNLSATATVSGLKTDVNGGLNSIVQSGTRTAQYLVSSSQSYSTNDLVSLSTVDLTAATLGVTTTAVNLSTAAGAQAALATIDTAIGTVGTAIGAIGAAENRITYANANVKTAIENFTAANSVIKDVDMASEMTMFTKNQILSQAGTAMLAQANQLGAGVLQLLK